MFGVWFGEFGGFGEFGRFGGFDEFNIYKILYKQGFFNPYNCNLFAPCCSSEI